MRVLLVDQYSEPGGAQRGLLDVAAGLVARRWELHAALPEGPVSDALRKLGASVEPIKCGPFRSVRKSAGDVLRFAAQLPGQIAAISRVQSDVMYVNGPRVAMAAVLGSRGRPWVFHSHSVLLERKASRVLGTALRSGRVSLVASSEFVAEGLRGAVGSSHVRVIYNGVEGFGVEPKDRERYTRVGVLGRIAPEKGTLTFVRAARLAAAECPGLRFVVCGGPIFGSAEYMDAVRREAGPEVSFLDWTDNIATFFEGIDLLVVPSEGIDANPRVIPEAYAAGVPVVAFPSGGIAELIEHAKTGVLVEERSAEALGRAIVDAVADPARLNVLARAGYARWKERYTLGRFQSDVAEVLEEAVRKSRKPLRTARPRPLE